MTIRDEQLMKIGASVVEVAMAKWDSVFTKRHRPMGATGGRESRRGPIQDADALRGIEHLSVRQQAARIGCSVGTVHTLRKKCRALYGDGHFGGTGSRSNRGA